MVERTVQTEVLETVEEEVTFCDSCGDPTDDPEVVFTESPEKIYKNAISNVSSELETQVGNYIFRNERVESLGGSRHSIQMHKLRKEPVRAEKIDRAIDKALKNARDKEYTGGVESYHMCGTCKRGLNDTDRALAANTAGSLAEEADQEKPTGPTFTEKYVNEISLISAIITMFMGALICAFGPWLLGVPFLLGAIPVQLGMYRILE